MRLLENKIEGCKVDTQSLQNSTLLTQPSQTANTHQTLPMSSQSVPNQPRQIVTNQTLPLSSQTATNLTVPSQPTCIASQDGLVPQQNMQYMRPSAANNVTLSDLYQMPELNDRVQLEIAKLLLVGNSTGPINDRDTFYRQLVQDTVKQASGKLKIKSGLELESHELVRQVVYWPHAFTSELSHCVNNRKATNIDIESFIFGTINYFTYMYECRRCVISGEASPASSFETFDVHSSNTWLGTGKATT